MKLSGMIIVITSIGLSIMQVGIDWAAGGKGNPEYGSPIYLGISFAVLLFILLVTRFAKGFMSNVAVLLGIVFGFGGVGDAELAQGLATIAAIVRG